MIILFDTSTNECRLWLYDASATSLIDEDIWQANRNLAEGCFHYIESKLSKVGESWHSVTGIGVFRGPGSFTGLRIGMTILNTLAADRTIPIVGATHESWREECLARLRRGEDDKIVVPEYGRDARITSPRK